MKTYIDNGDTIIFEKTWIPKKTSNSVYQQFLNEQKEGEAKLVPYIPTWEEIRVKRDVLLKDSDWSIFPDTTPKPSKEAWLVYRQVLRDIPNKFSKPEEVVWPEKP
jgi:hypothetical protein